jgi:hypothetical protein
MAALGALVVVDVAADRIVCFRARLECAAVGELFLERSEEAFGDGIVPAIARSYCRPFPALEEPTVLGAGVLAATVGVMDQAEGASTTSQSVPEGRRTALSRRRATYRRRPGGHEADAAS